MHDVSRTALAVIIAAAVFLMVAVWSRPMTEKALREPTVVVGSSVRLTPTPPRAGEVSVGRFERTFINLTIIGYQPPRSGRVEVVVRLLGPDGRAPREISKFLVFPNQSFVARGAEDARAQLLAVRDCPPNDAGACIGDVEVSLEPLQGTGEGATLTLGAVEIELK